MPVTLNNATVNANGYVGEQTVEDAQTNAAATAPNVVNLRHNETVASVAGEEHIPTSTLPNVGASRVASQANAALLQSSTPELPYQQIARADAPTGQQLMSVVSNLNLSDTEAYRILRQAGQKAFDLDSVMSRAANQSVISAKLAQVKDLKEQIHGERTSASTQLAFSLLGAGAGILMGVTGNLMRGVTGKLNTAVDVDKKLARTTLGSKDKLDDVTIEELKKFHKNYADKLKASGSQTGPGSATGAAKQPSAADPNGLDDLGHQQYAKFRANLQQTSGRAITNNIDAARQFFLSRQGSHSPQLLKDRLVHSSNGVSSIGAGIDGGAQGVQSAVAAAGTAYDKNSGGQYDADQAKLAGKQDEVQVSLAQQVADAAKSSKDRNLKQVSDNLDALKEVAARYAAVIDKLT